MGFELKLWKVVEDMEGIPHPIPRTVEEVFNDFKGRRAGLIKALTAGSLISYSFLCFIFEGAITISRVKQNFVHYDFFMQFLICFCKKNCYFIVVPFCTVLNV